MIDLASSFVPSSLYGIHFMRYYLVIAFSNYIFHYISVFCVCCHDDFKPRPIFIFIHQRSSSAIRADEEHVRRATATNVGGLRPAEMLDHE